MTVLAFLRGRPAPRGNPDDGLGRSAPATEGGDLAGPSAAMRALREEVARYGEAAAPVLILGESGTGKELVARALQRLKARRRGRSRCMGSALLKGCIEGLEHRLEQALAFEGGKIVGPGAAIDRPCPH